MNFYNLVLNLLVLEKTGSSEQEFNSGLIAGVTTTTGIFKEPNVGTSAGVIAQKIGSSSLTNVATVINTEDQDIATPKTPKRSALFSTKKKKRLKANE